MDSMLLPGVRAADAAALRVSHLARREAVHLLALLRELRVARGLDFACPGPRERWAGGLVRTRFEPHRIIPYCRL